MFLATVNDRTFKVNFAYCGKDYCYAKTPEERVLTVCTLEEIKEGDKDVHVGLATCYHKDTFDKRVGRKKAFSEAVRWVEEKEVRKVLWDELKKKVHVI